MNSQNPYISFCIPSFNRCERVYALVSNILTYHGKDIEVVVLDNCSTDETKTMLSRISDTRFTFLSNAINIGGILNVHKVISEAKGVYSFLCLDKDFIDYREIPTLIKRLKVDNEVVFGYCSLNQAKAASDSTFEKGFSSVLNMAYLGKHPSGYFYNTNLYRNSKNFKQLIETESKFPFNFELINAEISFKGKSKIINIPLFHTEKKSDCVKVPSHTYNKDNLYFAPHLRLTEYKTYMKSVGELDLLKEEKIKLIKILYTKGLFTSTIGYKSILSDYDVCMHHGIETRKVGIKELIKIDWKFSSFFLKERLSISLYRKFLIFTNTHLRIAFNMSKGILKKVVLQFSK